MNVNEIASLGSNVKPVIQNENCSVLMLNDATGEGVMTVYRVMPGVMICFSDMHMEQCASEFELKNDRKIFCIDHCREGRIEMEVKPGVFSIMQEKELRLDNRENHKGTTYYPLKHYHGVSIFMEVAEVQKALDELFHGFSVSIEELRSRYCAEEKPYVIRGDKELGVNSFRILPEKHGTSGTCKSKRILSDKSRGIIVVLKHDDRRRQERSQTILLQNSDGKNQRDSCADHRESSDTVYHRRTFLYV